MSRRLVKTTRAAPAVRRPPTASAQPVTRSIPRVAGFRLVRQLGAGARCDVFLAIPDAASVPGGSVAGDSAEGWPIVIKAGRPDSTPGLLLPEADALSRMSHPHVLKLFDVAQVVLPAPGGGVQALPATASCLVVERLPRESLAALLLSRSTLRLGEAITILAPIADAVDSLHRAGVAHGALSAAAVLFRDSGAPVLARFGAAKLFAAGQSAAALDSRADVLADRAALRRLAAVVLARVGDDRVGDERVGDERGWDSDDGAAQLPDDMLPASLAARLFELGTPEPVDFVPRLDVLDGQENPTGAGRGHAGGRIARAARLVRPAGVVRPGEPTRQGPSALLGAALRAALRVALRVVSGTLATVRPRFWITGALVAIALVVALLAIPDGAGSDFERGAPARPSASGTGQSAPPANSLPAPTEEAVDPGSPLIRGDDPVAALGALLDARAGCYRQLSTRCLAGIDQQGSAALSSDLLALQGMQGGGEVPPRVTEQPWRVQLVQRLGGSALMRAFFGTRANSKPAPILVMRTEAGWRIRDYLEE